MFKWAQKHVKYSVMLIFKDNYVAICMVENVQYHGRAKVQLHLLSLQRCFGLVQLRNFNK